MAQHIVCRFYAELKDFSPKIWRRFEVIGDKSMAELGYILMTLFEMQGNHLFKFNYDCSTEILEVLRKFNTTEEADKIASQEDMLDLMKPWRIELPFEEDENETDERWFDASECKIKSIAESETMKLEFEYDYGDGWCINIKLESREKIEIHASELPRVLTGEGFGIIEDCGGPGGLENLATAFKKKTGADYREYVRWLGSDELDLAEFDIDDLNFRLKKLPRIFRDIYEYEFEPTQRSIDIIERKYKK